MLYSKKQIMDFIPHRDPFLFLDSVESIERDGRPLGDEIIKDNGGLAGLTVKASFKARGDHPIFAGHFPGNPILPGVVQVEMMAQAACIVASSRFEDPFSEEIEVALLSVNDARFRKPVVPEMILNIEAFCTKIRGSIMAFDAKILHEGKLISETKLLASLKIN